MIFDSTKPLRVEFIDGHIWRLLEDFAYFDQDHLPDGWFIDVPAGFVTDFASIPRIFWAILPPADDYAKAAVIHDWLYCTGRNAGVAVTRGYADGIFLKAMAEVGVGRARRWTMYLAVRAFAGSLWNTRRRGEDPRAQAWPTQEPQVKQGNRPGG